MRTKAYACAYFDGEKGKKETKKNVIKVMKSMFNTKKELAFSFLEVKINVIIRKKALHTSEN